MRLGILTHSLPPQEGGIVDHTVQLAQGIRQQGHEVIMIGGRGAATHATLIVGEDRRASALDRLLATIAELGLDHLVLQYTPLMYARGSWLPDRPLVRFWRSLSARMRTSVIVHETYFLSWSHPTSLLRGSFQKTKLKNTAKESHIVFTASQPLIHELDGWGLRFPAVMLPISSNIPVIEADVAALRTRHGIITNTLVLTLFGGGNNLKWMMRHIVLLEQQLNAVRIAHTWLLLGGVPRAWLPAEASVLAPGWLSLEELSAYMQMTDIFLMPNWVGVSAKRGTLMAALEHGLAVVGTRGYMSDDLWNNVEGVILADVNDARGFCEAVLSLARDPHRRRRIGHANREYFSKQFAWSRIADELIKAVFTLEDLR